MHSSQDMYRSQSLVVITPTLRDKLFYPLLIVVIGGLILNYISRPEKISDGTADTFFAGYVKQASQAERRHQLYRNETTRHFRNVYTWQDYNNFWSSFDYAERDGFAQQVAGNQQEFHVKLTFYPPDGHPYSRILDYHLACAGFIGSVLARATGCPLSDVRIDSDEFIDIVPG